MSKKKSSDTKFDNKLSKIERDAKSAQQENAKTKKGTRTMKKNIIETVKTVVITALITFIAAFIAGAQYQKSINIDIQNQVKSLSAVAKTESKE